MSLAWIWRRYEICVKIRWIERLATFMPFENNWHFNELFICVYWERWINLMVGESDECEEVLMMIRGSKLSIYRILWFSMTHSIKMKYLELSSMVSVLNGWLCSLALSPSLFLFIFLLPHSFLFFFDFSACFFLPGILLHVIPLPGSLALASPIFCRRELKSFYYFWTINWSIKNNS